MRLLLEDDTCLRSVFGLRLTDRLTKPQIYDLAGFSFMARQRIGSGWRGAQQALDQPATSTGDWSDRFFHMTLNQLRDAIVFPFMMISSWGSVRFSTEIIEVTSTRT